MKKSGKVMLLGIGILLIGIMSSFYLTAPGNGTFANILSVWIPMCSAVIGLILLLVGFFMGDNSELETLRAEINLLKTQNKRQEMVIALLKNDSTAKE